MVFLNSFYKQQKLKPVGNYSFTKANF